MSLCRARAPYRRHRRRCRLDVTGKTHQLIEQYDDDAFSDDWQFGRKSLIQRVTRMNIGCATLDISLLSFFSLSTTSYFHANDSRHKWLTD